MMIKKIRLGIFLILGLTLFSLNVHADWYMDWCNASGSAATLGCSGSLSTYRLYPSGNNGFSTESFKNHYYNRWDAARQHYYCIQPGNEFPKCGCVGTKTLKRAYEDTSGNKELMKAISNILITRYVTTEPDSAANGMRDWNNVSQILGIPIGSGQTTNTLYLRYYGSDTKVSDALNMINCKLYPVHCNTSTANSNDTERATRIKNAATALISNPNLCKASSLTGNNSVSCNAGGTNMPVITAELFRIGLYGNLMSDSWLSSGVTAPNLTSGTPVISTDAIGTKVTVDMFTTISGLTFFATNSSGNLSVTRSAHDGTKYTLTIRGNLFPVGASNCGINITTSGGSSTVRVADDSTFDMVLTTPQILIVPRIQNGDWITSNRTVSPSTTVGLTCAEPKQCFTLNSRGESIYNTDYQSGNMPLATFKTQCCPALAAGGTALINSIYNQNNNTGFNYYEHCEPLPPTEDPDTPTAATCYTAGRTSAGTVIPSIYTRYATLRIITEDDFKKDCCSDPETVARFGVNYCSEPCENPDIMIPTCSNNSSKGHIYETGYKGITNDNIKCLTLGKDHTGASYKDVTISNAYCDFYCKDDAELYYPGFGYNSTKDSYNIMSGSYFKFKPFLENGRSVDPLPVIDETRTCVKRLKTEKLIYELYGVSYPNFASIPVTITPLAGSLYDQAKKSLDEFVRLYNLININEAIHVQYEIFAENQLKEYLALANEIDSRINLYLNGCIDRTVAMNDTANIYNFTYDEIMNSTIGNYEDLRDMFAGGAFTTNITSTTLAPVSTYSDRPYKDDGTYAPVVGRSITFDRFQSNSARMPNPRAVTATSPKINSGTFLQSSITRAIDDYLETSTLNSTQLYFTQKVYVMRPTGEIQLGNSVGVPQAFEVGQVFPVSNRTGGGIRNYEFSISGLGVGGRLDTLWRAENGGDTKHVCNYFVSNSIICEKGTCIECTEGNCVGNGADIVEAELNLYFRSVNLGLMDPNDRKSEDKLGINWDNDKGEAAMRKIVSDGESIYAGNNAVMPMYSFTLDTNALVSIRAYNKQNSYSAFDYNCNDVGYECESEFINEYEQYLTTDLDQTRSNWYYFIDESNQGRFVKGNYNDLSRSYPKLFEKLVK